MSEKFKIDTNRKSRLGFDEVIFGASKSITLLNELLDEYTRKNENVLITKLKKDKAHSLLSTFKNAFYDEDSQIFILNQIEAHSTEYKVGIISAGSSDIGVANEAFYTLSYMGINAKVILDVGVAGLHRLLNSIDVLKTFDVLIVVAGFEGALPTVVGGLLPQPIIAVPTSVGYGIAKNGETALNAMLTSCANGIVVTNIDNGYGAAMGALRILNLKGQ